MLVLLHGGSPAELVKRCSRVPKWRLVGLSIEIVLAKCNHGYNLINQVFLCNGRFSYIFSNVHKKPMSILIPIPISTESKVVAFLKSLHISITFCQFYTSVKFGVGVGTF